VRATCSSTVRCRASRLELRTAARATDHTPDQSAPAERDRGEHVLTPITAHLGRRCGSVVRLFLRQAPDPRHLTSFHTDPTAPTRFISECRPSPRRIAVQAEARGLSPALANSDMAGNGRRWQKGADSALIVALACGQPVRRAAETAGVSERTVYRQRRETTRASGCDAPGREARLLKTAKIERHAAGTVCRHHCKSHVRIDDEAAVGRPVGNFAGSGREPPDV
jgi:hypothetical protein